MKCPGASWVATTQWRNTYQKNDSWEDVICMAAFVKGLQAAITTLCFLVCSTGKMQCNYEGLRFMQGYSGLQFTWNTGAKGKNKITQ